MYKYKTHYKVGEYLFNQGDEGDCAFIIESGTVKVYINKPKQQLVIATLVAGDLFGEMAIIDHLPRTASAIALEDTDVIIIPSEYVQQKIELSDPTVRFFLRIIMERYRDMHARLMKVLDGINPDEADYQDMYATTTNVVRNLMHQYLEMQDRIRTAVNYCPDLQGKRRESRDISTTRKTLKIEKSIEQGLENNEFRLFYQPILDLSSMEIKGCEALVRWQHPDRGLLGPFDFIPHAENTGLILPLGYWIAEQGCRFQQQIASRFRSDFFTNINLSGKQFEDNQLVTRMNDIVSKFAHSPSAIKFEITESLLMADPEKACASLNELKESGARLAIDDFGTGYSSLSYLHRFPFDTLKVDRSFVSTLLQNKKSNQIVKSLIGLAHNLDMNVVAEGIETSYEEEVIQGYQAEFAQGFLYSRPVEAEQFIELLNLKQG